MSGPLPVPVEARLPAAVTYYLAETCIEVKTDFTPMPTDFMKWVKQPAKEIWARPENHDVLESLMTHEPLARIRYRRSTPSRNGTDPDSTRVMSPRVVENEPDLHV